jgi:hypothetical protein
MVDISSISSAQEDLAPRPACRLAGDSHSICSRIGSDMDSKRKLKAKRTLIRKKLSNGHLLAFLRRYRHS